MANTTSTKKKTTKPKSGAKTAKKPANTKKKPAQRKAPPKKPNVEIINEPVLKAKRQISAVILFAVSLFLLFVTIIPAKACGSS